MSTASIKTAWKLAEAHLESTGERMTFPKGSIFEGISASTKGLRIQLLADYTPKNGGPPPEYRILTAGTGTHYLGLQRLLAQGAGNGALKHSDTLAMLNKLGAEKARHCFNLNMLSLASGKPSEELTDGAKPTTRRLTITRKKG